MLKSTLQIIETRVEHIQDVRKDNNDKKTTGPARNTKKQESEAKEIAARQDAETQSI